MATSSKRGQVEGEGSYTASRRYREGAESCARSGQVTSAARSAKKAVEGREGKALRSAEKRGKRGPAKRRG
jgi:hypothetical protein